mmetsp:Transcript_3855/g.24456  ORF Transcript_3855/g.24456 Transcript_3855/m.24456 type:complete len:86 (+) Transcript_3855:213-470(+)
MSLCFIPPKSVAIMKATSMQKCKQTYCGLFKGHFNERQQETGKGPPRCIVLTSIIALVETRQGVGRDRRSDRLQLHLSNLWQEDE